MVQITFLTQVLYSFIHILPPVIIFIIITMILYCFHILKILKYLLLTISINISHAYHNSRMSTLIKHLSKHIRNVRTLIIKNPYKTIIGCTCTTTLCVGTALYKHPEIITIIYDFKIATAPPEKRTDIIHKIEYPLDITSGSNIESPKHLTYDEWITIVKKADRKIFKQSIFGRIDEYKNNAFIALKTKYNEPNLMINEIIRLYGNSIEAYNKINEYIEEYIEANEWISCESLDILKNYDFARSKSPIINTLINAILICPIPIDKVIAELYSDSQNVQIIKSYFDKLSKEEKDFVVLSVLTQLVYYTRKMNKHDELKQHILNMCDSPMVSQLIKDKIDTLIAIFNNLKPETCAQIIKNMIINKDNENQMILEMIDILGPIGIKIAQLFAEDPLISVEWKNLLKHCQEKNKKLSYIDIYSNINMYGSMTHFGKCLGVGSIKQVHLIKNNDKIMILGIKKNKTEERSKEIINAIKIIPEFKKLAKDFEKIVKTEMNLNDEVDGYDVIKTPRFMNSNLLSFPDIYDASSNSILRENIKGKTIAKLVENNKLANDVCDMIIKMHELIIQSAFIDNIVFSDLHFGNFIFNEDTNTFVVIDVGQYATTNKENIITYMWMIADVMSEKKYLHIVNMNGLIKFLKIKNDDMNKVENIFLEAYKITEKKNRILHVLSSLNSLGYNTPSIFMSLSKMIDVIIQQKKIIKELKKSNEDIDEVISNILTDIFKQNMIYSDYLSIGSAYVKSWFI